MFVCGRHWKALPPLLKRAIYREYVPGQEVTKTPSARYMAVQRYAVGTLAFKPHDEEAAQIAARYFIESQLWRQRSIDDGDGDPLATICPPHERIDEEKALALARALRA